MQRPFFAYFLLLIFLTGAATIQQRVSSPDFDLAEPEAQPNATAPEADQRLIFLLQYLASDYDRAVHDGQIIDSLEYREMQRFARQAATIYRAATNAQQQTSEQLRELERLIAQKAPVSPIRKICAAAAAFISKEKNLFLFPSVAPDLADGEKLFRENCVACHGERGSGNGPAADTLNPKPRDFTAPERMNLCTPLQFYQAVTFGVEGTAMASFAEAFTPEQRWNLAFYLMTLRRDFEPFAPAAAPKLSLRQLAAKNNLELADILLYQQRLQRPDSMLQRPRLVDYRRQNPPELSMDEHLRMTETRLKQSLAAHERADSAAAIQLAEEAYWLGFEPIERRLLSRVYLKFERTHTEYHWCIEEKGAPERARALVQDMLEILQQIRGQRGLRGTK
jgi:high-affinity iron transporter